MIPKTIHYCWFGKNEKPSSVNKCIASWKKHCPDYDLIEWNEDNFDFTENAFAQKAYEEKRWAFVSDYVRLKVIYEQGGIYLDTDVEVIKNLDPLLSNKGYIGFEDDETVSTGPGFGAEPGNPFVFKMLSFYSGLNFDMRNVAAIVGPEINTAALCEMGLERNNKFQQLKGFTILPSDYFCPRRYGDNKTNITSNTFSIHHYDSSWFTPFERFRSKIRLFIGPEHYDVFTMKIAKLLHLR